MKSSSLKESDTTGERTAAKRSRTPGSAPTAYSGEQTLAELRFVRRARELVFSLDEISKAMPHFRPEPPFCDQLEVRLLHKREAFRAQIREAEAKIGMIDDLLARLGAASA